MELAISKLIELPVFKFTSGTKVAMLFPSFTKVFLGVSALVDIALAATNSSSSTALSTSGRYIVNSSGNRFKLRCINCKLALNKQHARLHPPSFLHKPGKLIIT